MRPRWMIWLGWVRDGWFHPDHPSEIISDDISYIKYSTASLDDSDRIRVLRKKILTIKEIWGSWRKNPHLPSETGRIKWSWHLKRFTFVQARPRDTCLNLQYQISKFYFIFEVAKINFACQYTHLGHAIKRKNIFFKSFYISVLRRCIRVI